MIAAISALVLVLMLAIAPSAEAECAWVLWKSIEDLGQTQTTTTWALDSASPGHAACIDVWKVRTLNLVQEAGKFMRYICLPDTIDPRGPKGGGR